MRIDTFALVLEARIVYILSERFKKIFVHNNIYHLTTVSGTLASEIWLGLDKTAIYGVSRV